MTALAAQLGEPVEAECPGCGKQFQTRGKVLYCSDCLEERAKEALRNMGGKSLEERARGESK